MVELTARLKAIKFVCEKCEFLEHEMNDVSKIIIYNKIFVLKHYRQY